jgi:hypothetical protein
MHKVVPINHKNRSKVEIDTTTLLLGRATNNLSFCLGLIDFHAIFFNPLHWLSSSTLASIVTPQKFFPLQYWS